MRYSLPDDLKRQVADALDEWDSSGKSDRLWARDATLWTGEDEHRWLAWLDITKQQLADCSHLEKITATVRSTGFSDALLLGMGGSSLCPEVLAMTFGRAEGFPRMHVLDSTDPAQVRAVEDRVDLANTLFLVASKSGTTLEPTIFQQYSLHPPCERASPPTQIQDHQLTSAILKNPV